MTVFRQPSMKQTSEENPGASSHLNCTMLHLEVYITPLFQLHSIEDILGGTLTIVCIIEVHGLYTEAEYYVYSLGQELYRTQGRLNRGVGGHGPLTQ